MKNRFIHPLYADRTEITYDSNGCQFTTFIADAIMQNGDPCYGGLLSCFWIIGPSISQSAMKHDSYVCCYPVRDKISVPGSGPNYS